MFVDTESDSSVKMSFLAPFDLQIASLMTISGSQASDKGLGFALISQSFNTQIPGCVSSSTSGARAVALLISRLGGEELGSTAARCCCRLAPVAASPARRPHHKSTAHSWSQADLYSNGERAGGQRNETARGESEKRPWKR